MVIYIACSFEYSLFRKTVLPCAVLHRVQNTIQVSKNIEHTSNSLYMKGYRDTICINAYVVNIMSECLKSAIDG